MRLIDADEAIINFGFEWDDISPTRDEFVEFIKKQPTIEAEPVKHGRWEDSIDEWLGTDVYTCSKCRESYVLVEGTPKENLWHYCPNCGADMRGEEE